MINLTALILPFILGALLGLAFFGGLWWTIQKAVTLKNPGIWFSVSLLLRTAIVVVGFYLAGQGQWERFLICLLGFLLARMLLTRPLKTAGKSISTTKSKDYG